ncbi:hypothetical protein ASPWEDRAFT_38477 [Aspergillus wentii DTO 134E9]|uniref:Uncharacterized protein n=1 Tax=Aspergillus wentii DTO 134E9 TaxID=1073089 RepID=A0A1L9RPS9_ASPWE|nr:uncharacterized protein ASPWEDRAFT_38477 [Aspergillus wentii DTO 134E9]OJJ36828.1 hypothetical protein ASPWEDRAFT_38477 [Aspergillus wentii DTO 134E9]
MASEEYNSSDLTSILKTLSALSNPASQNQVESIQNSHHQEDKPEEDSYEPSDIIPPNTVPSVAQRNPATSAIPQTNSQLNTPATQPTGNTITIDPSTITAWPAALRYVMRTVSQSEEIQRRIRRLIQSQHDHEKQWWQGREALLKKQSARVEKKKELDEVL